MKIPTIAPSIIFTKMIPLIFPLSKTTSILSLRQTTSWHSRTQHNSRVCIYDTILIPLTYIYSIIYTYFRLGELLLSDIKASQ